MKKNTYLFIALLISAFSWQGMAQVAGESCTDPIVVNTLPFNASGNTGDYGNNYASADKPSNAPGAITSGTGSGSYLNGNDVVFAYTPTANQMINVTTTNDDDWIGLWAFTGCSFDSTVGYHMATSGTTRAINELPVLEGTTYYFVISTWPTPDSTDFTINIEEEIPDCPLLGLNIGDPCDDGDPDTINDIVTADCECEGIHPPDGMVCEAPIVINALPYTDTGNTENFGDNYGPSDMPLLAVGAIGNPSQFYLNGDDVVYAYTPVENSIIDISVTGHGAWAGVFVFTGCSFSSTVGGHTNSSATLDLEVHGLPVEAGETYYIVISTNAAPQSTPYTLGVIDVTPSCMPPTALATTDVVATTAAFEWAPGDAETSWSISWGTLGYTPGDTDEINTATVSATSYQITGLTASTDYDVYVQADCGAIDGVSTWTGPVSLTTTQIPASLPYIDDFTANQFSFVNGTQTNRWEYGSAAGNPSNAIYISNDGGTSNAYTTGSTSVVQAYRDILIPTGATTAEFSFDWRAKGEGFISTNWDYFRVWLVPATYIPTSGTQISSTNDRTQIGGNFNDQEEWGSFSDNELDISAFAGQVMRLVFEWRNDFSGGTQPPAAIDNILLEIPSCPVPTALATTAMSATTADIGWTAGAAEQLGIFLGELLVIHQAMEMRLIPLLSMMMQSIKLLV